MAETMFGFISSIGT